MKKLLATTAIASMAFTGAASAQSLLERVLSDISAVPTTNVTGIFANTADNVLAGAVPNVTNIGGTATTTTEDRTVAAGDVLLVNVDADGAGANPAAEVFATVDTAGNLFQDLDGDGVNDGAGEDLGVNVELGATLLTNNAGELTVATSNLSTSGAVTVAALAGAAAYEVATLTTTTTVGGDTFSSSGIDASIANILRGLSGPTAVTAGGAQATEAVTALIGNLSTTALGAVNTGDIQLIGSNQSFAEDIDTATAGTSEAIQQTINHTITQVGTTAGQTMLAINSALNETNVNASVTNVMSGVNTTIGRSGFEMALSDTTFNAVSVMDPDAIAALTGGISTTGLGAVNTGTIISGANDTVTGVITSIVGNAATNAN